MPRLGLGVTARRGASPALLASLPSLDLDFLQQRYQMSLLGKNFADLITVSRASSGGRINASGWYESIASNLARFDYEPWSLSALGVLIEEQRTNLLNSSVIDTWWSAINVSKTYNAATSPDGGSAATLITTTATGSGGVYRGGIAVTAGNQYTVSALLAPGTYNGSITIGSDTGSNNLSFINLSTGVVTNSGTGVGSIKNLPNGWKLLQCTFVAQASTISIICYATSAVSGNTFYMWGAQLEAGSFRTTLIPTSGAQATRAADIFAETISPWFNPLSGSAVWEGDVSNIGSGFAPGLFKFDFDSTNRFGAYISSAGNAVIRRDQAGVIVQATTANSITAGAPFKAAFSWDTANLYVSLNGGTVATVSHSGLPTISSLVHGKFDQWLNGHERKFKYFPKAKTGAALQALSA